MSAEEIEETAARWLAREDRGLTADERKALDAWLAGSTNRRVAYLRLKAVWSLADRLADLPNLLVVPDGEGDCNQRLGGLAPISISRRVKR